MATIIALEGPTRLSIDRRTAAAVLLTAIAVVLAIIPLGVILWLDLWPPATIGQENYTLFVTAFSMMRHGYFFARNAFSFSLAYAYPATVINYAFFHLFPGFTPFQRFGAFGLTAHALCAISIIAACGRTMLQRHLLTGEKLMIIWLAFGYQPLSLLIRNFTELNYHMLEALIYVICADMTIRWLWHDKAPSRSTIWLAGALSAFAIGTKLTFAVAMAPYFALLCLAAPVSWRAVLRSVGEFCLAATVSGAILLLAYLEFHIEYVPQFLHDLVALNTDSGWLVQRVPALVDGLRNFYERGSVMHGFSMLLLLFAGVALMVLVLWPRLPARCRLFVAVNSAVFPFFLTFAYLRVASNTFVDFVIWMTFELVILTSMIIRLSAFRWIVLAQTAFLAWVCSATIYYTNLGLPEAIAYWKSQGDAGRAIDAMIERDTTLTIVYYMPEQGVDASFRFPSVDITPFMSGDRRDIGRLYTRPRASFASVSGSPLKGRQVAVLAEKISGIEMPHVSPALRDFFSSPHCSPIDWGDSVRGYSRVTVCVVS